MKRAKWFGCECDGNGLINMGATERGGADVWESCTCQPPQKPITITNPDDLMDAAIGRGMLAKGAFS